MNLYENRTWVSEHGLPICERQLTYIYNEYFKHCTFTNTAYANDYAVDSQNVIWCAGDISIAVMSIIRCCNQQLFSFS